MKNRRTKQCSSIREKRSKKDYAGTEGSPYQDWLENKGDYNQEHVLPEPVEANPDNLAESDGLFYQAECNDYRLDIINSVIATLTDRQKEILRICGNEGRTLDNCALMLGISKGTVQKTLERIREKVEAVLRSASSDVYNRGE